MLRKALTLAACLTLIGFTGIDLAVADSSGLLPVRPVPNIPSANTEERQVYGHAFTDLVDGLAFIVEMSNNMIYFSGDLGYPFASRVAYYDINGERITRSFFRVGDPAAYKLNQDGQVESLWEVKERNASP